LGEKYPLPSAGLLQIGETLLQLLVVLLYYAALVFIQFLSQLFKSAGGSARRLLELLEAIAHLII